MLLVLLFAMIFCHVVDDYYLQGVLAKLKQKESWPQDKPQYRHDYIAALAAHAFSWAFSHEEKVITAEEDVVLTPAFWSYCNAREIL